MERTFGTAQDPEAVSTVRRHASTSLPSSSRVPSPYPSFNRWFLLLGALLYITAAWFGVGHYSEDEFHQVLLVSEHLLGHVDAPALAQEYHLQWRSMVQPLLGAGAMEVCEALGITDPFQLTFVLRLLTAMLALWVTHGFIRSVQAILEVENKQAFTLVSYFLWFIPVLQIRFTGEAWSGLLFLRGLGMLIDPRERKAWAIGAWFGAAVIFRPAAALLPMGAVLWMLLVQHASWKRVAQLVAPAVSILVIGGAVDSFIYGHPVSTLWNYIIAGLTGQEAERFTSLPWYQYALFTVKHAVVPIGVLIILAFATLLLLRPKHVLIWTIGPFLLVHSMVAVKEVRFLFPLAPLIPWLLIAAWEALQKRWPTTMARTIWLRVLFAISVVNAAALLTGITTPAGNGKIKLAQAIQDRFRSDPVHIDYLGSERQWIPPFYLSPKRTERFTDRIIVDPAVNGPIHLVIAKQSLDLDRVANLERMAIATPPWTDRFLRWYGLEDGHDPLVLYHVTTQTIGH